MARVADAARTAGQESGAASELVVGSNRIYAVSGEKVAANPDVLATRMKTPPEAERHGSAGALR